MGVKPFKDEIDTIVLTHCHFDHTAWIKEIAFMCKAKVAIHKNDARGLVDDIQSLSMHFGARSPGIAPDISIDREDLCRKISAATKAILITHFFGFPQDIDVIRGICDKKGIFLIEDCSHALFSTFGGKPVGSIGDISVFSLKDPACL